MTGDILVNERESCGHGFGDSAEFVPGDEMRLEIVVEGAERMIFGDQPQLHGEIISSLLGTDEAEDAVVFEGGQRVDFLLRDPRLLVGEREDFHRDAFRLRHLRLPNGAEPTAGLRTGENNRICAC